MAMTRARRLLRFWLPFGLVHLYWKRHEAADVPDSRERLEARERRRAEAKARAAGPPAATFSYGAALDFLDDQGIDPDQTRVGSMPLASLAFMRTHLDRLGTSRPLLALHVGNFLGVSLAYLAHALSERHLGSKVVSIDPNLTHRGVPRTMETVLRLLTHFGLEDRVAILTGYSLEKNLGNQGELFPGYDPLANWAHERACTQQLALLVALAPSRFDLCLMDGNHDGDYLRRELDRVQGLLRPGGLLVLDDVSNGWPEIQSVFDAISPDRFQRVGADGRIGVLIRA
jgi:predicted O-methyltransferase YrrM